MVICIFSSTFASASTSKSKEMSGQGNKDRTKQKRMIQDKSCRNLRQAFCFLSKRGFVCCMFSISAFGSCHSSVNHCSSVCCVILFFAALFFLFNSSPAFFLLLLFITISFCRILVFFPSFFLFSSHIYHLTHCQLACILASKIDDLF